MKYSISNEKQEINRYFQKFILLPQNHCHIENHCNIDEPHANIRKKIEQLHNVPFNSDWNYLMTLVQIIENKFCRMGFVSEDNYCRFEFGDYKSIQDKGMTKMDAMYSCCYRTLKAYWKEEIAPPFHRGAEPFDPADDL